MKKARMSARTALTGQQTALLGLRVRDLVVVVLILPLSLLVSQGCQTDSALPLDELDMQVDHSDFGDIASWGGDVDVEDQRSSDSELSTGDDVASDIIPYEPWTLVVLPDTQDYSSRFPYVFMEQTEWIVRNADALNIRFVAHVGDLTDNNTSDEYKVAAAAFQTLEDSGIPFAFVPGNHDYEGIADTRKTLVNAFFSPGVYASSERMGFFQLDSVENSWHVFTVDRKEYLVLALEFGPREDVVAWAKNVVAQNPNAAFILLTHAFLYSDDSRYDWWSKGDQQDWNPHSYGIAAEPGGVSDGEELWQALVRDAPSAMLVLCGHTLNDGIGHAISLGTDGNVVHQLLANFQEGTDSAIPEGGGGYMRLLRFEGEKRVAVKTYSPYLDSSLGPPDNEFVMTFDPADYSLEF